MTPGRGPVSRRRLLAGTGTALAAGLAGCSRLSGATESPDPNYDASALAQLAGQSPPDRPATFPVEIPRSMLARHRRRAQELVRAVPESPVGGIPNAAVRAELVDRRGRVVESVEEGLGRWSGRVPVERLRGWRGDRTDAAEVRGFFRAATGAVDAAALRSERDRLRTDVYDFLDDWEYAGTDPVAALAVHAEIEDLVYDARRTLESPSALPADPTDAPDGVGDVVGSLESARASVGDAGRIRRRFREGVASSPSQSYRTAFAAAADRLRRTVRVTSRPVESHLDAESRSAAYDRFSRDLTESPAGTLLDDALDAAERRLEDLDEAVRDGRPASAVFEAGDALASVVTLTAVVDAVGAGEYATPESLARVRTLGMQAVNAIVGAWNRDPAPLTATLSRPAVAALAEGYRVLDEADDSDVGRALASFAYAKHYADAVPPVADRVDAVLRDSSG